MISDSLQPSVKLVRSFGRVKSRRLSDHKKLLLADLLPKYEIVLEQLDELLLGAKCYQQIYLEIGFGFGDFLFANSRSNPDTLYLGGETHLNGIVNLLTKLEQEPLANIKVFKSDVRLLLAKIANSILDKVYILFPDPWPKSKHYKRRLISADFIALLAKKMKNSAELVIASDHDLYQKWIINQMLKSPDFLCLNESELDWQIFPEGWVKTKYQKKAEVEGRKSICLRFKKIF